MPGTSGQMRPRLIVRPAPILDPPFDEERHQSPPNPKICPEMLPPMPRPQGGMTERRRRGRPGPGHPTGRPAQKGNLVAIAPERAGGGPGAIAARRFVGFCLEVINGFRPVAHLRPLIAPHQFAAVAAWLPAHHRQRAGPPGRALNGRGKRPVRIRQIQLCEPSIGVVEAALVLDDDHHCWAIAVRLERHPTGWQCVVAQLI